MVLNTYYRSLGAQIGENSDGLTFNNYAGTSCAYAKITDSSYFSNLGQMLVFDFIGTVRTNITTTSIGVAFGDGAEPVTPDDWKLSGNLVTGIVASATIQRTNCAEYAEITAIYTITNGNAADVTISEVGTYGRVPSGTKDYTNALVERTVLDSPVTIPAGGVGQVTYTIRMNYPTA